MEVFFRASRHSMELAANAIMAMDVKTATRMATAGAGTSNVDWPFDVGMVRPHAGSLFIPIRNGELTLKTNWARQDKRPRYIPTPA